MPITFLFFTAVFGAIDLTPLLTFFGYAIYMAMAAIAAYGVYCVVVLMRRISQKSFPGHEAARTFLDDVGEHLEANDFDAAIAACDYPEVWRAVPQLVAVAVENRNRPIRKIRQIISEFFEREIIADFESRVTWLNTIVKAAPMLGLLGTVLGMIGAFRQIAGSTNVEPSAMAENIALALNTTAFGLLIAIPMVVLTNMVNVRITRLQDSVHEEMEIVLDDLEAAQVRADVTS